MKVLFRPLFIVSLVWVVILPAVSQNVRAVVADRTTGVVIPDVFVFLANSSLGTATGETGVFELELPDTREIVLVFSHINYEMLTLEIADTDYLRDTFRLQPLHVELEEAVVVEKSRSRLRKRRLKAFTKSFLGKDAKEQDVAIKNPEVLLFEQSRDKLIAKAAEPLLIENRKLGYALQFYLEAFELFDNGDLYYQGNTFFEPMMGSAEVMASYRENRQAVYQKSSRSFFSDLVRRQLDTTTFIMGFSRLDQDRNFTDFQAVNPSNVIFQSEGEQSTYEIIIEGFLTVINQNILVEDDQNLHAPSKAEMNYTKTQFTAKGPQHATSYLRSKTNRIQVSKYGKILNPSDIEEYGYWAGLRVSALLPSDYSPEE